MSETRRPRALASTASMLSKSALRIFFKYVKHVAADRDVPGNPLGADLAMTVPGYDPIIAIDNVKRDR